MPATLSDIILSVLTSKSGRKTSSNASSPGSSLCPSPLQVQLEKLVPFKDLGRHFLRLQADLRISNPQVAVSALVCIYRRPA